MYCIDGTPRVEEGLPTGAPRVFEVKEGETSDLRLAHYTIDLLALERIHSLDVIALLPSLSVFVLPNACAVMHVQFGTLPVLPPNTVLFAMPDGLYAVKLVADVLVRT